MRHRPSRHLCERHELPDERRAADVHAGLVARSRELAHLDQLLWHARRGRSGALALRGESGVGKSALIESTVARATEFHTVQVRGRTTGDSGTLPPQWPDPALNDLASSLRATAPELPVLAGADDVAGRPPAPPPKGVVDAAASSLRRMIAGSGGPLLVTVDDCQALPPGLVAAMAAAVTGELADQPVNLVLAWRDTPHIESFTLGRSDVPVHRLGGLTLPQARDLLASRCDQMPAPPVLAELVGRTGGNPLALIDLCGRLSQAQLAGWHPLPDPLPVGEVTAEAFDVVRHLPPATRRALTVVAAGGAPAHVLLAAMQRMGVSAADLAPAIEAGVVTRRGGRIDFRHPLVRSVAFYRAPPEVRRAVRGALSDALAEVHAIEASAYHASVDVVAPDEVAVRRLSEAAQVALDRGEPAVAARHEELAARCAASPDAVGQHLADAAGHWLAAGERERANYCVGLGGELALGEAVSAELAYRRSRLATDEDPSASDGMVAAADACLDRRPHRALAMLIDAAACRVLADDPTGAAALASRAVHLAGVVSAQSEVLARAVRASAALEAGTEIDDLSERSHVSLLIGQTERFPSSPEVALVVGRSLAHRGLRRQADRWGEWIRRCAERSGDVNLAVVPLLLDATLLLSAGDVEAAAEVVTTGTSAAEDAGSTTMAKWGLQLAVQVHAAAGEYEYGLRDAATLFAMSDGAGAAAGARLRALPALALLELQRGRGAAAVAWANVAAHDLVELAAAGAGAGYRPSELVLEVAPMTAAAMLLARRRPEVEGWPTVVGGDRPGARGAAAAAWLRGVSLDDPRAALEELAAAAAALEDQPLRQGLVETCMAVRLAESGMVAEAIERLDTVERRMTACGAVGLAAIATRERHALPQAPGAGALRPAVAAGSGSAARRAGAADAEWEICVLGGFSIRRRGRPLSLPASLATQAIKILALHPRMTVDELIELLWEEAEPGVGARRLRNVLWRIRSACGDMLVRDGNFLRLAAGATTDLERFRALADQAIVGVGEGSERPVETARAAVECYRGELLPGDRYADWAVAARESAARTYLRLLELLVEEAVEGGRQGEALVLIDRLVEADPYDERHHLRSAEIHLDAGNRGRALDALERAERMLADLGVAPPAAILRLRERLYRP